MTTYSELYRNLLSWLKFLPPTVAMELINQAREDIYSEYFWSFLYKEGFFIVPNMIQTGTVSVVKYSTDIVASTDLKVILDAITVDEVPLEERQIRILGNGVFGTNIWYNIKSYNTITGIIKLSVLTPYLGNTNSSARFQISKIYFNAPETIILNPDDTVLDRYIDFESFSAIIDLQQQRRIYLDTSVEEINKYDSARTMLGVSHSILPKMADVNGNMLYELYPYNITEKVYKVIYRAKGRDFVEDSETLPAPIPKNLILSKAKYLAYQWAEANKGSDALPELRKTSWINLMTLESNRNNPSGYEELLAKAKLKDEELFSKSYMGNYDDLPYFNRDFIPCETLVLNF